MTPQEKAEELVSKMLKEVGYDTDLALPCALIAVDEIMNELSEMNYGLQFLNRMAHWEEVKEEIENL